MGLFKKPTEQERASMIEDAARNNELLSVNGRMDGRDGAVGTYVLSNGKTARIRVSEIQAKRIELGLESPVNAGSENEE